MTAATEYRVCAIAADDHAQTMICGDGELDTGIHARQEDAEFTASAVRRHGWASRVWVEKREVAPWTPVSGRGEETRP